MVADRLAGPSRRDSTPHRGAGGVAGSGPSAIAVALGAVDQVGEEQVLAGDGGVGFHLADPVPVRLLLLAGGVAARVRSPHRSSSRSSMVTWRENLTKPWTSSSAPSCCAPTSSAFCSRSSRPRSPTSVGAEHWSSWVSVWPVAWLAEFASTRVGIPFGLYHYTESHARPGALHRQRALLRLALLRVPRLRGLLRGSPGRGRSARARHHGELALVSGVLMMLLDVVIDPLAVRGDRWFLGPDLLLPRRRRLLRGAALELRGLG